VAGFQMRPAATCRGAKCGQARCSPRSTPRSLRIAVGDIDILGCTERRLTKPKPTACALRRSAISARCLSFSPVVVLAFQVWHLKPRICAHSGARISAFLFEITVSILMFSPDTRYLRKSGMSSSSS
jgi:hypothetical protein